MEPKYYILIYDGVECLGTVSGEHCQTAYFDSKKEAMEYIHSFLDGDYRRYKITNGHKIGHRR